MQSIDRESGIKVFKHSCDTRVRTKFSTHTRLLHGNISPGEAMISLVWNLGAAVTVCVIVREEDKYTAALNYMY